jgi:membrane dipeptidase
MSFYKNDQPIERMSPMDPLNRLPIFDGHNDTFEMLYLSGPEFDRPFFEKSPKGHIDLPRALAGGFAGGLFAIFAPSRSKAPIRPGADLSDTVTSYAVPMASTPEYDEAHAVTLKGMAGLFQLEAAGKGRIQVVHTAEDIEQCFDKGILAIVVHFEGAEAIDTDLDSLYVFHRAGLRSLGIAWSRNNAFGHGVPYRFPESPDIGPGLTEAGERLVRLCNSLGILVDVSHLNEKGFWDVERVSDKPMVATHSGVHALCPSTRNLTDKQLDAIGASGGIVGVNFHVAFLRSDGRLDEKTPIAEIIRHIDYIIKHIGIDHVGFGSDFDGATMPEELGDVAGLPKLIQALRDHGFDDGALEKITHKNWLRVIKDTLKP